MKTYRVATHLTILFDVEASTNQAAKNKAARIVNAILDPADGITFDTYDIDGLRNARLYPTETTKVRAEQVTIEDVTE